MLKHLCNTSFEGKTVVISGSGNVAIYATQKAMELGAKVVALSDSSGYVYDKNGGLKNIGLTGSILLTDVLIYNMLKKCCLCICKLN